MDIVVIDMPLLDTRRDKNLLGTFISDLVLQLLSFISENERTTIRQRQAEGIAAAKKRGVRFGRPTKEAPPDFDELIVKWQKKEMPCSTCVSRKTAEVTPVISMPSCENTFSNTGMTCVTSTKRMAKSMPSRISG